MNMLDIAQPLLEYREQCYCFETEPFKKKTFMN